MGKPEATLRGWINRGLAYPDEEPFGSFAVDYRRAERGILGAIAGTAAMRVQLLAEQMKRRMEWEQTPSDQRAITPPETPDVADMLWLEKLRASRAPEDYGTSKHRKPEPEYDGQEWLGAHEMQHEQLAALFTDPPDAIRGALVSAAPAVYAILIAGGFDPAQPERATNGRNEDAGAGREVSDDRAAASGEDAGAGLRPDGGLDAGASAPEGD